MAIQKKHGKGRLDKWYKLAKEKGYRARAAFKLIQLNKKYGFLEKSKVLLDLCAAPGSWCQVAAEVMPVNSLIVGVDLAPIKPIPRVITFQSDITTEKCRATIRQHFKTWKADTVLHDGAPNVGTAWAQDSFNQAELALQAMKLATEFLVEGGTFVTKVFRSKDYNPLLWVLNQLFTKVEATKPPSSRNVSAEIFVVCRGYKAPKKMDPRFLDPKSVFAELAGATPNNEAKVYNPEVKKRKREGYEEGDYTQFKEVPASEFIQTTDPIAILGSSNKLTFEQPRNGDVALAALDKLPETTAEIRTCCADLKVLGRKDFKLLLKWRLRVREIFGFKTKTSTDDADKEETEEVAEVGSMDEELRIQEELQALKDKDSSKKKREKRKENERKQREIVRMQLNMVAPMDIGMEEAGPIGEGSMFSLKKVDKTDAMRRLARGKMTKVGDDAKKVEDNGHAQANNEDEETDEEEDRLERELDSMYDNYRERKAEADAKYRAKKARKEHGDDEWEGLSGSEKDEKSESSDLDEEDSSDDDDEGLSDKGLLRDLDDTEPSESGLSKRAAAFFNQDVFKGITLPGLKESKAERNSLANPPESRTTLSKATDIVPAAQAAAVEPEFESESDNESKPFETVKAGDEDWEDETNRRPDGKLGECKAIYRTLAPFIVGTLGRADTDRLCVDIDIITAEAMTLAHQLATGQKTSHDAVDDGFNKWAFRDRDGLPEWFIDEESKHDKPMKPITKAAAQAIKEKMRAFNARPIKKVREAKARKKFKAAQKLEKLKKKSDMLANDEGMTEKEKAESIAKLLSKAARKKPSQPAKLVVAKGLNRGIQGRPKGIKGRYRMVDPRMKKELRAQKRVSQRKKR
ncbi:AdoMet-dependent rRNA methyltransferase spb1 [Purpureocillium takamizusanense]|uniref:AdoMet-dependent rRNA methyltransferase spb1 n=1 Tax=Purpureocillium takamizusanense TaxID=2060973 RepID=A0A9Q8QHW5_9HYPO|nr:AdoMet-dependent rRNA methyltransferase spb1 [Purpureocillium takamizusanense]UNI19171.1 AdoMet-dependent rRNA methyltransferase spb1 [Purpureocillium takamizusanense]